MASSSMPEWRMLDEYGLACLAEMGIDVYLPRGGQAARVRDEVASPVAAASVAASAAPAAAAAVRIVLLIATAATPKQAAMLADVERALRFARVVCTLCDEADDESLLGAAALVLFGHERARSIGARLPAQRQGEVGWVVAGEPAALVGDAQARRALWSELRRLLRQPGGGAHPRATD